MTKQKEQSDKDKLQRMLLWFEASLPEHEIGEWVFEVEPTRLPLVDEETGVTKIRDTFRTGVIVGHGTCIQCRCRFELERWGNYAVYPNCDHDEILNKAKISIINTAKRSGKCWGNVPKMKSNNSGICLD